MVIKILAGNKDVSCDGCHNTGYIGDIRILNGHVNEKICAEFIKLGYAEEYKGDIKEMKNNDGIYPEDKKRMSATQS